MNSPAETLKRTLTLRTGRLHSMPILTLMPHSRCNCRCLMCDIWRDNANKREISAEAVARWMDVLRQLGTRWVVLSGGEPLMHSDLFGLCRVLRQSPVRITLLSTGLLLAKHAQAIVANVDDVIVSLDGSEPVHNLIRNVPRAYERLAEGVAALKTLRPDFRITARCTLQRANYADLPNIIHAAHDLSLDQISFLAVDVSTTAFNRPDGWEPDRVDSVALDAEDVARFRAILDDVIARHSADFQSGFIAESPAKLRRLASYFGALLGEGDFPQMACTAPWVSAVIEADGTVRPCFFHRGFGNAFEQPLDAILNSDDAIAFRRNLDVRADPICRKCVCALNLRPRQAVNGSY
jgi:MoaA/NifB/PqqE/SkfB family radical SAM enzyme